MLTSVVVGWGLCFNQKTEYEMRISDWSSDVCSSDLSVGRDTFIGSLDSLKRRGLMVCVGTASGTIPPFDPQILALKGSLYMTRPALDRKSVVSGVRVSVRVDLGGRRIIKKKRQKTTHYDILHSR